MCHCDEAAASYARYTAAIPCSTAGMMGDHHLNTGDHRRLRRIGGCASLFFAAIVSDLLGLVILFVGIFANLTLDGRFYGDFLIYSGALVIFCSLALWLMWYVGNIQVADDEDLDLSSKKRSSFALLARKLSERLNANVTPSQRRQKFAFDDDDDGSSGGDRGRDADLVPAHKPSKVTWGKSSSFDGFVNKGYDDDGAGSTASSDPCPKEPAAERPELPPNCDGTAPVQ